MYYVKYKAWCVFSHLLMLTLPTLLHIMVHCTWSWSQVSSAHVHDSFTKHLKTLSQNSPIHCLCGFSFDKRCNVHLLIMITQCFLLWHCIIYISYFFVSLSLHILFVVFTYIYVLICLYTGVQPPEFMQPMQDGKLTTNTPVPEIKVLV